VSSVRNLGFIFDQHLSLQDHITSLSKACFFHIKDLRRIRPYLDLRTASTIATSLVHSKLDYCNSLFLNLSSNQLNKLQFIQNSVARTVSCSSRFCHITPILKSLHWLKIRERISYKIVSLTHKLINLKQPQYLSHLLTFPVNHTTRSATVVTLLRPTNPSRSKITDRSFKFAAPQIWNSLPPSLRISSSSNTTTAASHRLALSPSQFHAQLKTHLFSISYPSENSSTRPRPSRKPPN
jgi:hypothetical protein